LLTAAGWTSVLDSLQAPEEAWAAIEAAIGGELEQALVWREGDLVGRLAEAQGAARLLASANGQPDEEAERAVALGAVQAERTLAEWIGESSAGLRLFRRTVVAPDLPALLSGWTALPAGWLAVTPRGDVADGRGVVSVRGEAGEIGGAAARRHARRRELADALEGLEAEQSAAAADAAREMAAVAEASRAADEGRRSLEAADAQVRASVAALDDVEARHGRATASVAAIEDELSRLPAPDPAVPAPGEPARALGELEQRAVAAAEARRRAAEDLEEARQAWTASQSESRGAEERQVGQRREHAAAEARLAQLEADAPRRRADLEAVAAELAAAAEAASAAKSQDHEAAARREEAEVARQAARAELIEMERQTGGGSGRLSELERAAHAASIEASRHEEALAALAREREVAIESLPQAAEGTATPGADEAPPDGVADLADDALEAELRRVRRTLGQIGSVNPFAVDEHRELATRLDELSTQETDLSAAIGSTEELIARLDQQITEQFSAAFEAIGERFDEFCRLLFAGGSASLQMGDGEDGDAPGGIEIVVRPPGKRLQRLAMLSGGERALTGVALLFAMLSVNPVPFCILDEVDAALDEANIGRFADALRKLSESIDFVVITHNRATIEVADTIYGVTMTDAAVSRIVSLRLADLPAEVTA
jgi:chromosome segregation protein